MALGWPWQAVALAMLDANCWLSWCFPVRPDGELSRIALSYKSSDGFCFCRVGADPHIFSLAPHSGRGFHDRKHLKMYIPLTRERVRIQGRDGLFLVLRVNYRLQVADVAQVHSNEVEEDVPFSALYSACEDPELQRKLPKPDVPPRRDARRRL